MARSTYIYTVVERLDYEGDLVLGSFTVKHEMLTAVAAHLRRGLMTGKLMVLRSNDGVLAEPENITLQFTFGQ